ncbi:MAG TPA: 16S rRNA (guanine(527)-N(7))-methyltransferase RsmG [Terriglobales bacterium]|nr:16S rRNA (guanine(527)-N(7))-methyltransferase RsmG [Terriglobales bacterium]
MRLYLDLLLRWNARVNLTAIRDPEQIVTRHFGESLFAAKVLGLHDRSAITVADVGSGAGFPGIPMKLWVPQIELTLLESQNKKAVFLREVLRRLELERAVVFCGRAENWGRKAEVVALRAVERFEHVLPVAAGLTEPKGRLCLLIGSGQMDLARSLIGAEWTWREPLPVPRSTRRVVAVARRLRLGEKGELSRIDVER